MPLIKFKLVNTQKIGRTLSTLRKTLILITFLIFNSFSFAQTQNLKFEGIPDWKFGIKQTKDKLFTHDHKNFIGTLSKIRGDIAPTLFVFRVDINQLKSKKMSVLGFLNSELVGKDLTFLEEKVLSKNLKLRAYKKDQVIVYVYIHLSPKCVYFLTQDSTEDTKIVDLNATQFELSKMYIVDDL